MRHTVRSILHLMDDPPELSGMMDALAHIKWDIEDVLHRLPLLAVSGHSEHPEPIPMMFPPSPHLHTIIHLRPDRFILLTFSRHQTSFISISSQHQFLMRCR